VRKARKQPFSVQEFLNIMDGGRTQASFRKNQKVYAQGDPADSVFYVQAGKLKVVVVSEQGKEAVVALHGEGDFFGEGCLTGQPLRVNLRLTTAEPHRRREWLPMCYKGNPSAVCSPAWRWPVGVKDRSHPGAPADHRNDLVKQLKVVAPLSPELHQRLFIATLSTPDKIQSVPREVLEPVRRQGRIDSRAPYDCDAAVPQGDRKSWHHITWIRSRPQPGRWESSRS
jgi:CRP-like cAMP-binding protein